MSDLLSGVNYAVLFGSSNTASSLVGTIEGYGTSSTAATSGNPVLALQTAEKNQTKDVATEQKNPAVIQAVAGFKKGIAQAKTIQQALANPNVMNVLLTAYGLTSLSGETALISKALLSNPSDPKSLLAQLGNASLTTMASSLNLAKNGLTALKSPAIQSDIVSGYAEQTWLNSLDQTTPGLSYALNFKANVATYTSANAILGDATGWEVVTNALSIPQELAYQDNTAQQKAITSRLNIAKLQDPKFLNTFLDQYLLNKQAAAAASGSSTPSLSALSVQATGLVV